MHVLLAEEENLEGSTDPLSASYNVEGLTGKGVAVGALDPSDKAHSAHLPSAFPVHPVSENVFG